MKRDEKENKKDLKNNLELFGEIQVRWERLNKYQQRKYEFKRRIYAYSSTLFCFLAYLFARGFPISTTWKVGHKVDR